MFHMSNRILPNRLSCLFFSSMLVAYGGRISGSHGGMDDELPHSRPVAWIDIIRSELLKKFTGFRSVLQPEKHAR